MDRVESALPQVVDSGEPDCISDHTTEIRYKAVPKLLDFRGQIVNEIGKKTDMVNWKIDKDSVQLINPDKNESIFIGYRNASFYCIDSSANYFKNRAQEIMRQLLELSVFGSTIYIERIGVRFRFLSKFLNGFEELRDRYTHRYLNLTPHIKEIFSAEFVDIGGTVEFKDDVGKFIILCGPMREEQSRQYFNDRESYPKLALYFDIDYSIKPQTELSSNEVTKFIKTFSIRAWNRHEQIRKLICEE